MAAKSARSLWAARLAGKSTPGEVPEPASYQRGPAFTGRILGVDPSLRGTGLAALEFTRPGEARLLGSLTLKLKPDVPFPDCLGRIAETVDTAIQRYEVRTVAFEETIFVQNFKTAQILGAARGAALSAAARRQADIHEYAPLRIKQAVVGFGRASKQQVARTVQALLHLAAVLPLDEADAAAAALCHGFTSRSKKE
ncbi:MAG: crossover junction endodeoxyribonuclease RuvC [Opitutales bacterium]